MSAKTSLRKRISQINYKDAEGAPRKKIKEEEVEAPAEDIPETVPCKQPIIAPNGKIFYPCQFCSKVFPQKTTSITHMKKCPKKVHSSLVESKNESNINNNEEHRPAVEINGDLDHRDSNTEYIAPEKKIMITQNITVKEPCIQKQITKDASVYDFDDDPDSGKSFNKESKENEEDALNNRLCKVCKTVFDDPLDVLRHVRQCHNFPKTLLPPEEIQKYFDAPIRDSCPICEKPIKTRNFRSVFIKHLITHTTGLMHECDICKKKFRRRDHMRAHQKRHIIPDSV